MKGILFVVMQSHSISQGQKWPVWERSGGVRIRHCPGGPKGWCSLPGRALCAASPRPSHRPGTGHEPQCTLESSQVLWNYQETQIFFRDHNKRSRFCEIQRIVNIAIPIETGKHNRPLKNLLLCGLLSAEKIFDCSVLVLFGKTQEKQQKQMSGFLTEQSLLNNRFI